MDYFGQILDDLTDMWDEINQSPHVEDGKPVLKAIERAMKAAVQVERLRTKRAAAAAVAATGQAGARPVRLRAA